MDEDLLTAELKFTVKIMDMDGLVMGIENQDRHVGDVLNRRDHD